MGLLMHAASGYIGHSRCRCVRAACPMAAAAACPMVVRVHEMPCNALTQRRAAAPLTRTWVPPSPPPPRPAVLAAAQHALRIPLHVAARHSPLPLMSCTWRRWRVRAALTPLVSASKRVTRASSTTAEGGTHRRALRAHEATLIKDCIERCRTRFGGSKLEVGKLRV
jgi:hypothetical protein